MSSIYRRITEIENSSEKAALCTIISTSGSAPRKTGAKMLVSETGIITGTIGGGALEKKVAEQAHDVLKTNVPARVIHNLVRDLSMCCGGTVELFIEPIMNRKKLYIFGAGHTGKSLAGFAPALDFDVTLIDDRYDMLENPELPDCTIVHSHHTTAVEQLPFDDNTFVVIVTYTHANDREILALTSKKKHGYIGMIGSERKVLVARKNLLASHTLEEQELDQIDMPIGVDIHAITPQEIAISILARLIEVRNKNRL